MPRNVSSAQYDNVAKTLHWLIAFAIIVMLIIGFTMTLLPKDNPYKFGLFQWHKSIGLTILLLSLFRLGWRLAHPAPLLPDHMPAWEKFAARATHFMFYVLIIGMPLTGWIIVSTSPLNIPTMLYGVIHWPNLPVPTTPDHKKEISHVFTWAHIVSAYIMVALLALHVAAAQKHHWIDRDDILTRMAPGPIARLLDRMRGARR